jgi:hypothetical protein
MSKNKDTKTSKDSKSKGKGSDKLNLEDFALSADLGDFDIRMGDDDVFATSETPLNLPTTTNAGVNFSSPNPTSSPIGSIFSNPQPFDPAAPPQVQLVGDATINEGDRGSYRLQIDRPCDMALTFTIRIENGTAIRCFEDGSGQKYKGDLRKGVMPELNDDFTVYDSQNGMMNDGTITLTIPAGETASEAIFLQTWEEQVSMGGRKVIDASTALGEGRENLALHIVDNCGCQVIDSCMDVVIIDDEPYKWHSPLAIDLNNDGVKSVSIDKGVTFDIMGNGTSVNVGWLSKQDGWLAVDSNDNGKIDSQRELFGGEVGEGFAKLSQYDSNGDNVVDSNDANFSDLKIWRDGNTNGVTDRGELQSLSVFGIKSLNVEHIAYQDAAELDDRGNILGERGSVNTFDGGTLSMVDLYVQVGNTI